MSLVVGQVLQNRYRIVKWIGGGGFGNFYKVWDVRFGVPSTLCHRNSYDDWYSRYGIVFRCAMSP